MVFAANGGKAFQIERVDFREETWERTLDYIKQTYQTSFFCEPTSRIVA
jgi:hypothetical protein